MESLAILAQAAPAAEGAPQGGGFNMLLFLVLMFAAMYFLMIAPQRKRQKAHQKMISELQTGDKVLTIGGMIGVITNVDNDAKTFTVKVSENTKIEFVKSAIQEKLTDKNSEASAK
ncbi:MAG: preprotein translocase subunit YajC [Verrucomicrobia bacterium]|nr:MAG: preprotein translocase subunit YajC [Verrucomicrobiota bacterium]